MIDFSLFSIESCRRDLKRFGFVALHDFISPSAVAQINQEAQSLRPAGFKSERTHDVYLDRSPSGWNQQLQRSSKTAVAYDQIAMSSTLRAVYESDLVLEFVRKVLAFDTIYRSADPLDACEIAYFGPGQELGWHFDESPFAVTLMIQPCGTGGAFEFAPVQRDGAREELTAVRDILDDGRGVTRVEQMPGTLTIFSGRNALHRVSQVMSGTRVNAVFTYSPKPGMQLTPYTREMFYGRRM